MTLLPDHADALSACVSSVLAGEALDSKPRDEVLRTMEAVLRVARSAIATYSERWNAHAAPVLHSSFRRIDSNSSTLTTESLRLGSVGTGDKLRLSHRTFGSEDTSTRSHLGVGAQAAPNNMLLLSDRDDARKEESRLGAAIRLLKGALRAKPRSRRNTAVGAHQRPCAQPQTAQLPPPDVLIDCFEWLSFNERLCASHVCRYWRRVALDTPLLWSTFEIGPSQGSDKLEAMLCRTQAVPMCVTLLCAPDEQTDAMLGPHFPRLRALRCQDAPGRLDVPLLETLEISRFQSDEAVLSADYVGCSGQSLRTLQLRAFRVAPTCPVFARLREFRGVFNPKTDVVRLLELCPQLEALTVWCDINLAVDPTPLFVELPPGLTEVTINGLLLWSDPSYHSLRRWLGHRFRRVALSRVQDISSALHLFGASLDADPEATWSMQMLVEDNGALVADNGVVTLTTNTHPDTDSARAVVPAFPRATAFEALWGLHVYAHRSRLTSLRLAPLFFDVLVEDGIVLPGLVALTVVIDREEALPCHAHPVPGIHAPRLRMFALATRVPGREAVQWFFGTLPRHLREWLVYDSDMLESVALEGAVTKEALKKFGRRGSTIYSLAREVRLGSGDGTRKNA